MHIGSVLLKNTFVLAPLAGYTDLPFRLVCREQGAGLTVSEMISCHGLVYGHDKTLAMLRTLPAERPWAVQLFGNEAEIIGRAAALLSEHPADILDINMGCPVRKVVKKGSGVSLMKPESLAKAEAIIRAVIANTDRPVTVKFRSGWNDRSIIAPEFAQMCEAAGAAAVTIHARTWAQQFGGRADRKIIAAVKQAVSIPVIGNGDILTHEDGLEMMAETGCDAVMIGRGALGNPWLFRPGGMPETLAGRLPVILCYLQLAEEHLDTERLLFRIKNHTGRFLNGLPGAVKMRQEIMGCRSVGELRALLQEKILSGSGAAHPL
ncbi:MAG: tRNA dihydrouridine synthase DusB [Candidatus Electrothrix sp. YB6]